ncbi:MAG TPA: glucose-6-phosphate dehydrogenase [Candidatus Limnocylindria bacterium]
MRFSRQSLEEDHWNDFARALFFVNGSFDDLHSFRRLQAKLDAVDQQFGIPHARVYYLAVAPQLVGPCVQHLRDAGMVAEPEEATAFTRIIVEKPIGHDLASAREDIHAVDQAFVESQTYRIDHYLGKETVQNILVLRFANSIFEPIWTRQYVDHVQITAAESLGIEERAGYYDSVGAMRDIVQNHLLQLLALVGMEPPAAFDDRSVRDEKVKVLRALRQIAPDDVGALTVRGQYGPGFIGGERVVDYHEEHGVAPDSQTETYVAMKCFIDNWRWEGTPFYIRTGKRLPKRSTEIAIRFRVAPHRIFTREASEGLDANELVIRIQPDEGISLTFGAKVPVQGLRIRSVNMDFGYGESFMVDAPDSYETLILDALRGDATLFTRRDEVEQQWAFVDPILAGWQAGHQQLPIYPAGAWGPEQADQLIARDGRSWRRP